MCPLSVSPSTTRPTNQGIGQFSIYPSQAYNLPTTNEQTVQISDTQTISPAIVNETRFQYIRDSNNQSPLLPPGPTLAVSGAFTSGGKSDGDRARLRKSLRAAELHLDRPRQALHQVWRTIASHHGLQPGGARL